MMQANLIESIVAHAENCRSMLRSGEVDVWRIPLDEPSPEILASFHGLLSPDEEERARRFFFARDRRRFVVARASLRILLGRYQQRTPRDLTFHYGVNGKPSLVSDLHDQPIFFNVAHSEDLAVGAFTRAGEVGIDVERVRDMPDWESVAEAAFSPRELAALRRCTPSRRREEFFRAWTRQEAVLKALGAGLGASMTPLTDRAFKVYPLNVAPGFAAALAAVPSANRAAVRNWISEHSVFPTHL